jgi:hypothetical protein
MKTWVGALALCALAACGDEERYCTEEPGIACTWLGLAGEEGFNGDGHHRLATRLYWSMDMLFAADGTPWFIDWNNHLVRKVLPDQTVQTVVGWTDPILPGDGEPTGAEHTAEGAVGTTVRLNHPTELAQRADGTILVMAWHNHKLREIDPASGNVRIVGGAGAGFRGDDGPIENALLRQPKALTLDGDGNIYIGDQQNFRVRVVDANGTITTIAGNGTGNLAGEPGGEDIPALESPIDWEAGSNPEPSGGMVVIGRTLYLSETLRSRIRAVDLDTGMISTFAGIGEPGYSGDGGPATDARLYHPRELEVGPEGDLYVADTDNNVIRAIDMGTGEIRTIIGTGELGLDPRDGLPATETMLKRPFGLEFDADGNLYIMDTINSRIVKVTR